MAKKETVKKETEKKTAHLLPVDVDGLDMMFGGSMSKLLPKYDDIPKEFKDWNGRNKWNQMFNDWFFSGIKNLKVVCREGVDEQKALRHLKAIMGSWDPKHEHKEAGCAYLMSEFFEDATYEKGK